MQATKCSLSFQAEKPGEISKSIQHNAHRSIVKAKRRYIKQAYISTTQKTPTKRTYHYKSGRPRNRSKTACAMIFANWRCPKTWRQSEARSQSKTGTKAEQTQHWKIQNNKWWWGQTKYHVLFVWKSQMVLLNSNANVHLRNANWNWPNVKRHKSSLIPSSNKNAQCILQYSIL